MTASRRPRTLPEMCVLLLVLDRTRRYSAAGSELSLDSYRCIRPQKARHETSRPRNMFHPSHSTFSRPQGLPRGPATKKHEKATKKSFSTTKKHEKHETLMPFTAMQLCTAIVFFHEQMAIRPTTIEFTINGMRRFPWLSEIRWCTVRRV